MADELLEKLLADIRQSPDNADGYYKLGLEYLDRKLSLQAMEMFETAIKHNREHMGAYFNLGNIMLETKTFDLALRHYLKALRINGEHAPSLFNAGLCYVELGHTLEAGNAFKKFLRFETSREWQHEARYQLSKLGIEI